MFFFVLWFLSDTRSYSQRTLFIFECGKVWEILVLPLTSSYSGNFLQTKLNNFSLCRFLLILIFLFHTGMHLCYTATQSSLWLHFVTLYIGWIECLAFTFNLFFIIPCSRQWRLSEKMDSLYFCHILVTFLTMKSLPLMRLHKDSSAEEDHHSNLEF